MLREAADLPSVSRSELEVHAADRGRPTLPRRGLGWSRPAAIPVVSQARVAPPIWVPPLPVGPAVGSIRQVRTEALEPGSAPGVHEVVVIHGSIIPETAMPRPAYRAADDLPDETVKETHMRPAVFAIVFVLAGLLAAGCTQPSSGGGSSAAAPAPAVSDVPASGATKPGY